MEPALTLANTPLDLQITICIFLHPSDILALRRTCKALERATRRRIVWVAVLRRVCLDNTLFLPSFPIPDMSDLELERAAMAPRRCIELLKHSTEFGKMILHPRTTRIIEDADNPRYCFIVPGGRYLVTAGRGLFVWDLGYASTADFNLVASVGLEDNFDFCDVQATPDGKGLVVLSHYGYDHLPIFEIYPQSEIPLLTQIANLDWYSDEEQPNHLLPDILISRAFRDDRIVFKVVDYRTNYSTCFSAAVDFYRYYEDGHVQPETSATKTAIIMLFEEGIFIWAIPLMSPQPSNLRDHLLDNNPTHTPPLFKIPFPDGHIHGDFHWLMVSNWYLGSWGETVYFDILYRGNLNFKFHRYKIIIKPDLSDASLHVLKMSEFISDDLMYSDRRHFYLDGWICEDALVFFGDDHRTWRTYTGLTSAPFTSFFTQWDGRVRAFCPTSGRIVYHCIDGPELIVQVVDLF